MRLRSKLIGGGGAIVLLASAGWLVLRPSPPAPPAKTPQIITRSTDNPAESKPVNTVMEWHGTATQPKYIALPSIKAEGYLQWVGVDQHRAIAVPTNIHLAGWFVDSQPPGTKGLSIIAGHVDGRTSAGIFKRLGELRPKDRFTITFGDDSKKTFAVHKIEHLPAKNAAAALFSQDPGIAAQVTLITCGGAFNKQTQSYEERIIVTAGLQ